MFAVCEFRVFGPDSGVLSTPNYPKPYVEHITCTFHIYGPADTVVLANFTDFSIEETVTVTTNINDTVDNVVANNSITEVNKLNDDSISYVDVSSSIIFTFDALFNCQFLFVLNLFSGLSF